MQIKPLKLIRHPSYEKLFVFFKYENLESCVLYETEMNEEPGNFDIKTTIKTKVRRLILVVCSREWPKYVGSPPMTFTSPVRGADEPILQLWE